MSSDGNDDCHQHQHRTTTRPQHQLPATTTWPPPAALATPDANGPNPTLIQRRPLRAPVLPDDVISRPRPTTMATAAFPIRGLQMHTCSHYFHAPRTPLRKTQSTGTPVQQRDSKMASFKCLCIRSTSGRDIVHNTTMTQTPPLTNQDNPQ